MEFIQSLLFSLVAFFGGGGDPLPEAAVVNPLEVEEVQSVAEEDNQATPEAGIINSENTNNMTADTTEELSSMLVAGGCFWCVESDLEKIPGVISVVSGYAGGTSENPTYDNYSKGGHREVVQVTYDSSVVSFEDLLIIALKTTDPTDDDGTFHDRGDQYSAAFYYKTNEEKQIIDKLITEVNTHGPYEKSLAVDIEEEPTFWPAEDYHQDYYKGTLSKLKYQYYRNASGRDDFIEAHWSDSHSPDLPWRDAVETNNEAKTSGFWLNYKKPTPAELKESLDPLVYKVTQEEGTEKAGTSPLDKNYSRGIYVDVLSGEPLYSSRDKFDSGTGWPSFVKPITEGAVTEREDKKLFTTRTEVRSSVADNHLGHVFSDGPEDRGGMRYCMNGVALRFVPEADMAKEGYVDYLSEL